MSKLDWGKVDRLIGVALEEDLGRDGDVTSLAIFSAERRTSRLIGKATGTLAGIEIFARVFSLVDSATRVSPARRDGDALEPADMVAEITGAATSLLSAERTALNFLSYLSGIASETARFVRAAGGRCAILDTRKILPGYRELAKYAVRVGGGTNHRLGLHDMVLIKDNHIDMAGSIDLAVERVRRRWGNRYRVEVECRTVDHVREAVEAGVDVIMLDNMSIEDMGRALTLRRGEMRFEISGNVTLDRVTELSRLGADFISVGALTHSVSGLDFSLVAAETDAGAASARAEGAAPEATQDGDAPRTGAG